MEIKLSYKSGAILFLVAAFFFGLILTPGAWRFSLVSLCFSFLLALLSIVKDAKTVADRIAGTIFLLIIAALIGSLFI